ncbi:MAG TPA: hypothetical protein VMM56_12040 [Planctomycetaceae bacterium]|nr:hypothetical protein [Planctomycetaceae bacterium]
MPIEFSCPHCQAQIRVADGAGGKQGTCPQCRQKLVVPMTSTRPAPAPETVQFRSAEPEPNVPVARPETVLPETFPTFEEPQKTTSYARKLRQKKRRSAGSYLVPLICGGILFGTFYWYIFHSKPALKGTLEAVVLTRPVIAEGTITQAGLSVDPEAFERVRESLEQQNFSLFDQHRLAEVELSANRAGLVVRVRPTSAARIVGLTLSDPELQKYVAAHAREFNDVRVQQIETSAEDFIRSWDGKSDDQRKKLPNLGNYRADMALASMVSGFGYHVALWHGTTSYPCVGVGSAGEIYFCVPKNLDQLVMKGRQPTPESLLFPGEYTLVIRESAAASKPNPQEQEPEGESKPADDDSEAQPGPSDKPDENEPEASAGKSMKSSDEK